MGRWKPDARGRLEQAAFELFTERGFEQTTVAEIAERAGLTERTFFRYFADKREVLFAGADALQELFVSRRRRRPGVGRAASTPWPRALDAAAALFSERHESRRRRQADHRRQPRAAGARADQARHARRGRSPTRCAGAASPSLPRASRPKRASPSSRWRSNSGSARPTGGHWPKSSARSLRELRNVSAGHSSMTRHHGPAPDPARHHRRHDRTG